MNNTLKFVKKFFNITCEVKNESDFWVQLDDGLIYHICEGTGDNLSQEDVDDGYVDYIYYDCYETLNDIHEDNAYDGGQIMLKRLYKSYGTQEIVDIVNDFIK